MSPGSIVTTGVSSAAVVVARVTLPLAVLFVTAAVPPPASVVMTKVMLAPVSVTASPSTSTTGTRRVIASPCA